MTDYKTPVVVDNGTNTIKAGFAGDENPRFEFPTVVGRPRNKMVPVPGSEDEFFIGHEAIQNWTTGNLVLKHPMDCQQIFNWDDMELLWHHAFYKDLQISPNEHPLLMTEAAPCPKCNREKMTQIMFETFNFPAFYSVDCPLSSLVATDRVTGLVLDFGCSLHAVPVYEGYSLRSLIMRPPCHESDLYYYLLKMATEQGIEFTSRAAEKDLLTNIKENECYVALDYMKEQEKLKSSPSEIERKIEVFPGKTFNIAKERFTCPESLFDPCIVGYERYGVHEYIYYTIQKCDRDIRKELCKNIVLSGGTSLLPGFGARLQKELQVLFKDDYNVSVVEPENRRNLTFRGAANIAASSDFITKCISSAEYDEYGPSIVHRKCL